MSRGEGRKVEEVVHLLCIGGELCAESLQATSRRVVDIIQHRHSQTSSLVGTAHQLLLVLHNNKLANEEGGKAEYLLGSESGDKLSTFLSRLSSSLVQFSKQEISGTDSRLEISDGDFLRSRDIRSSSFASKVCVLGS
jgi:hypothetical protein